MLPCKQVQKSSRAFQKLHVLFLCITLAGQFSSVQSCQHQACRSSMLTASVTQWEPVSAACNLQSPDQRRLQYFEMAVPAVSSHLLNVDCSPLGDVQGDVLLRGGPCSTSATVQLGCARQDLHIQTTCNQTHTHMYRQTSRQTYKPDTQTHRHTKRQTDRNTDKLSDTYRQVSCYTKHTSDKQPGRHVSHQHADESTQITCQWGHSSIMRRILPMPWYT